MEVTQNNKQKKQKQPSGSASAKNGGKGIGILMILLCIVSFAAVGYSMIYSIQKQYESELDSDYESMANSMYSVRNLISFEDSLQESYDSFDLNEAKIFTQVAKQYFEFTGISEKTLSDYAYRMQDCSIFYYPEEGKAVSSENAGEFMLGKSQMRMLKTTGTMETDDYDYTAVRLDGGWLCIQWEDAQSLYNVDFEQILDTCPYELCIYENATGKKLVSSSEDSYDFLNESLAVFDNKRTGHESEGIQAGTFDSDSKMSGVYFEKIRLLNRYSVFVYVPLKRVLIDSAKKVAPGFCLMAVCFIFIWIGAFSLRKKGAAVRDRAQCIRLGWKHYINIPVARHVMLLLLVGVIVMTSISAYLPLLNSYTSHNNKMSKNLNALVGEMQLSDSEWDKMESIFRELVTDRVTMIGDMMDMEGDLFSEEELTELTHSLDLVDTVVYDENGVAVMSTDGYVGYKLSSNPDDDEYILWNLLKQADTSIMREYSNGDGFFAAVRRTDAPGLICATLTDHALKSIKEQTDVSRALLRVSTDSYAKMYASASDPDKLMWATASSDKVRSIQNDLPKKALLNSYSGTNKIGGTDYYINTITDDNHIFMSVERSGVFTEDSKVMLAWIVPEMLIISLIILCFSCVYRGEREWLDEKPEKRLFERLSREEKDSASEDERVLNSSMKKTLMRFLKLVFVLLMITYFADMLFSESPVSSYLFSHQWEHKVGIFSLTTILLSAAFAFIGVTLLRTLLRALSGKMDARIATIGNLIISIIRFVLIIVVIIYSLYQIGVDTSVILTSAGVLSLIIGYGSQSVVSDLVSGIFLITEDQMRVGETLVLDGFRGEVQRIGLRTTTLKHYASVKVINNSKMVGFYNMSRDTNAVRWELSFPIEQDPEQVKSLIMDNKERFQKACKGNIIAGPIYIGIAEGFTDHVGHAHYTMQFLFVTDMEEWNSVRKRSFDTAYKIMLENGIKPSGGEKKPLVK
ncbi:Small-conductance mechanosensitive channel [Ruminococcus sp. YE71]|uniref:mechanosensitive ion channel family protein n=1 Tax=unclassified Ruminococcus TaxID=2608920 RepID=UPI000885E04F|nr:MULTISPECIES: mechanosensitive ion channel family protein [unclassified Ruminococcus]SDA31880.1 Small-conductance mechanosensitive channel [Ruminococcus sp. YE78]SFW52438.1 Small-conductance mechanosensitive channel [Ruminococcus sp. YE71]